MKRFNGYFGEYGGSYVPEDLKEVLKELEENFYKYVDDKDFKEELNYYFKDYVGRESPLYYAEKLTKYAGGAKIYLKREDLNHTGAHKINNAIGQALLAKRMGKNRIIAETGAGQHGVATATVCALFDMDCTVYMGAVDVKRQEHNVFRMELLGANVVPVREGNATLKEAVDKALEDFVKNAHNTFYLLGSAVGPHPYPIIVREFQSIIGKEARKQILEKENRLPDYLIACVGGGSNAIGLFHPFVNDKEVKFIGVEPAGKGIDSGYHAASISKGKPDIIHGFKCYTLDEKETNIHSIAAGLDYPGVGPEHSYYKDIKRAEYVSVTDKEALDAFYKLSKLEGIIPALESAHGIAYGIKLASTLPKDKIIIINLSGRGDKDINQIMDMGNII
ncbi:tryptophan synthase beta chain [Keratinibaculum paraultunense]|uniref:Tryptophan synthase beta chain n=1 Tax=Keratinibaculum paraultunense TaxID=1278232 RepID=A0A4R3L1F5_9FIRM|nr:tryptophan synthase subunit beta [Keratinibaculum paraultunense]QQY80321.1 tryptophan synthase subunit beta [Keratinibaculum paraultunense]TCS90843.1 tryptophan synthase beta chain [Keratinibaculum paraultunense]